MRISLYPPLSIHEIGQRGNQEDAIAQWDNRLFVLCDGMGGHEKGEVASQTICQAFVNWFGKNVNPEEAFSNEQFHEALEFAYSELDKQGNGSSKKMGTTLTLLYIHNKGITAAHIGDSRIYHIRPDVGVLYESRDHSLVFDLFQAGEITYEEMATHPQKNIITRAMTPGVDNRTRADIVHITDVQPSDYFYMCSDGMLENIDLDSIYALFSAPESDEAKRFILFHATKGNLDNHSAWLIHIKDVMHEEGDNLLFNEEPTARCNAINIIPQSVPKSDDDDVVIVKEAPKQQPFSQQLKNLIQFTKAQSEKLCKIPSLIRQCLK